MAGAEAPEVGQAEVWVGGAHLRLDDGHRVVLRVAVRAQVGAQDGPQVVLCVRLVRRASAKGLPGWDTQLPQTQTLHHMFKLLPASRKPLPIIMVKQIDGETELPCISVQ